MSVIGRELYRAGDRVVGDGMMSGVDITGMIGTVIEDETPTQCVRVRFDEPHERFHSNRGMCEQKHGWMCISSTLKLLVQTMTITPEMLWEDDND